jgi:putative CocE/NonD family hydrolase
MLIGPWMHLNYFSGLPADGIPDLHHLELRWYDRWLKGIDTRIDDIPQVTQYSWGLGHYVSSEDWPNPRMGPQRLYLRGAGRLAPTPPIAIERSQTFPQNPATGICTLSSSQWTAGAGGNLPCEDNTQVERALGNATYQTGPLTSDLQLDGPTLADVWITTTARDAPITVRLYDVAPDGSTSELTDGWLSAGFRAVDASRSRYLNGQLVQPWHPFTRGSMLEVTPGQPIELPIEVFPTNALIRAGHSLRLTVASGDFPHQLPPLGMLGRSLTGATTILTDPQHRSYLALPVTGTACAIGPASGTGCQQWPVANLRRSG